MAPFRSQPGRSIYFDFVRLSCVSFSPSLYFTHTYAIAGSVYAKSAALLSLSIARPSTITAFQVPDLQSHCPFPAAYHKNGDAIAAASEKWVENGCRVFTAESGTIPDLVYHTPDAYILAQ
jgi:hypothetical protein